MIPDSLVSLKIAKKHVDTQEMKDRIIREALEALTHYYAANAGSVAFPEMCISTGVILRQFKKNTKNSSYRKSVQSFLELLERNDKYVTAERLKIKDKSLREPAKITLQLGNQIKVNELPLVKESEKLAQRRMEQI